MKIIIENIRVNTTIGIYEYENMKRHLCVSLEITCDGMKAAKTGDIKDSIDYEKVSYDVLETVEKSKAKLLEQLMQEIINKIKENNSVEHVKVKIDKPGAVRIADGVSIIFEA